MLSYSLNPCLDLEKEMNILKCTDTFSHNSFDSLIFAHHHANYLFMKLFKIWERGGTTTKNCGYETEKPGKRD